MKKVIGAICPKALLMVPLLAASIISDDLNPFVAFSLETNHTSTSSPQNAKKAESWTPSISEVTQLPVPTYATSLHPLLQPGYYHHLPGISQSESSNLYRTENFPHHYEPNYVYPLSPQPTETSLGSSSKNFLLVSFIGLLLLFAIIQNSIASTKHKDAVIDALSSRKKRDLIYPRDIDHMTPEEEAVFSDDARIRCIQRTLCLESRKLLKDLGVPGKILAKYLTRSVKKSLKDSPGWGRLVEDAANAGLRDEDCDVVYRDCSSASVPPTTLNLKRSDKERQPNKHLET